MVWREALYNGNVERFAEQFPSRNSLFVWVLETQSAKKKRCAAMMSDPAYAHLTVVRLRSRDETEAWLSAREAKTDARRSRSSEGAGAGEL